MFKAHCAYLNISALPCLLLKKGGLFSGEYSIVRNNGLAAAVHIFMY